VFPQRKEKIASRLAFRMRYCTSDAFSLNLSNRI